MRKRVWIFNHYAEPPQYEVRVRNNVMAKYLMQAGYDVTIFAASTIHNTDINLITDGSAYIRREYDGLKFVHVKAPNYSGNGISRKINMLLFPFNLWRITRKLGEKPDVIVNDLNVMAMDFPFMIAKRYNVPIITEVRDLWPAGSQQPAGKIPLFPGKDHVQKVRPCGLLHGRRLRLYQGAGLGKGSAS